MAAYLSVIELDKSNKYGRAVPLLCVAFFVVISSLPSSAVAQERPLLERRVGVRGIYSSLPKREDELPLSRMNLEEMRRAGYIFAREQSPLLSSVPLRYALTAGIIVHGLGHYTLGDYWTGTFLLGMEVTGFLLGASGILIPRYYPDNAGLDILSSTLVATGLNMVLSSWVLDLYGTTRAQGRRLGQGKGEPDGLSVGIGYRLLLTTLSPVSHVIDLDIGYNQRWFFARLSTLQDVELNYQDYMLVAGTRFLRSASRSTFLGLSAYAEYSSYVGLGEYREISGGGKIFGSIDLGLLFPTLEGASLGLDVGWDLHFPYLLDDQKRFRRSDLRQSYMYYAYSRYGVSDALTITLGYKRREDVLLSPDAIPFGTFVTEFRYRTQGESDIAIGLEVARGVVIRLKGRINIL